MTTSPRRLRPALSIGVVAALSAVLFAANARVADGSATRQPQDLAGLLEAESDRVTGLAGRVDALRAEVDALSEGIAAAEGAPAPTPAPALLVAGGTVPVSGPGLTVQLDDAPPDQPGVDADILVVHQQDLQAVINALWAGGAEAMTLMGQRVVSTTAFECVGNVLRLHGRVFSPPYTVQAVGDPESLRAALGRSREVRLYQEAVDEYGLGWSVAAEDRLRLPAYTGVTDLGTARVPDDVDALAVAP
ncbi:DUF881 domain-containing protein [Cellulomonas marina]|uniref:Uncharacterized conserved protein YlxW, UPF0749 family n=1 Tax=Cellulomonas marina TaxID=988821 RepID=A0A1I1AAS5_9CELL|nr:DUF881 domain-containing protein [Cellulomonas marina]GIG30376.1 membrane protein [Cellulomonas marina]SFB35075.1 Uncharacterized conserved protein YlxW, UPF0749 family [Cellulomonas marina]